MLSCHMKSILYIKYEWKRGTFPLTSMRSHTETVFDTNGIIIGVYILNEGQSTETF